MTHLGDPIWLHGSWAALAALLVLWGATARRRRAARKFAGAMSGVLAGRVSMLRAGASALALALGLAAAAIALARPQGEPKLTQVTANGRDLVFVVDVSRSMLADDLKPSRLGRAKLWIKDLVGEIQGDRVGLVAFAGASVVKCPLTLDYAFFSLALEDLSPLSVGRGGTNIGDAIRTVTTDVIGDDVSRPCDIILITDGEDQDSFPVQAAEAAGQKGIRIITLGLGDEVGGSPVTVTEEGGRTHALEYQGKAVVSKQNTSTLAQIARATPGGAYFNIGTGTIQLDRVYRDLIATAPKARTDGADRRVFEEFFQIFLGAAVALVALHGVLGDGTVRRADA